MTSATESRELVAVDAGGLCIRGTLHRVRRGHSEGRAETYEQQQIGIVFLNPGSLPRSAFGDAAVYWADSFAKLGYPSLRFDFPGLGDSSGDVPADILDFGHLVNSGSYTSAVTATVNTLIERLPLTGVVFMGHCAGAVSAIYAADACRHIKGLVLLDPYFHLQQRVSTAGNASLSIIRDSGGDPPTAIHGSQTEALVRELPGNANGPLIQSWCHLATANIPILTLTPGKTRPKPGSFNYLDYLKARTPGSRVVVKSADGSSHSFADGMGRELVRNYVESWLNDCFPVPRNCSQESPRIGNLHQQAMTRES